MSYQQPGNYGQQPYGQQQPAYGGYGGNTSGQGPNAVVPTELQGLNWAAFLWGWIWSAFNGGGALWIIVGLFLSPVDRIYLLIKGNEVSWRGKQWESVEAYKATQRKWVTAGLIFLGVVLVCSCIGIILSVATANR